MAAEKESQAPQGNGATARTFESAVEEVVWKRLRSQKKKLRLLDEIQSKKNAGQSLTSEQESSLGKAPHIMGAVEELESLYKRLAPALAGEVDLAFEKGKAAGVASVPPGRPDEEWIAEQEKVVSDAVSPLNAEIEELKKQLEEARAAAAKREQELQEESTANIERLVDMLYFAATLDPFALQHEVSHYERHVCLVYAQQTGSTLSLADITNLAAFSRMLTTRAFNSHLSHAEALRRSRDLALRALTQPKVPLLGEHVTGGDLTTTVDKILDLDFVTLVPTIPGVDAGVLEGQLGAPQHAASSWQPEDAAVEPSPVDAYEQDNADPATKEDLTPAAAAAASGENLVATFFGKAATQDAPESVPNPEAIETRDSPAPTSSNGSSGRRPGTKSQQRPNVIEVPVSVRENAGSRQGSSAQGAAASQGPTAHSRRGGRGWGGRAGHRPARVPRQGGERAPFSGNGEWPAAPPTSDVPRPRSRGPPSGASNQRGAYRGRRGPNNNDNPIQAPPMVAAQ